MANRDDQDDGAESAPQQRDLCKSSSFSATSCLGDRARPCEMSESEDGVRPTAAPISANVIPFPRKSAMSDFQSVMPVMLRKIVVDSQRHIVVPFRKDCEMVRDFVYPPEFAPASTDTPAQMQGKRIKYWREQRGWTQKQLAARVPSLKWTSIATLEQGGQKNSKGLHEIAAALGVNFRHLTTGKGDPLSDVPVVELIADGESLLPSELTDELNKLEPAEKQLAFYQFRDVISQIKALRRGRKQG